MKILLFNRNEQYIATLKDVLSAKHTEKLNGENYLEIETLDEIEKNQRLIYRDKYGYWHEFIVKGVEEERAEEGIIHRVFAEHSFYETLGDYIEDKRPYNTTANMALENALLTTRWQVGQVDNLGINNTNFYHISAKEAVQKVAETWQGEIRTRITISGNKITGRYVDLLSKRGHDLGKRFSYTKDLESITRIIHRDDVITALYGYGKGEEIEDEEGNATGGFGRRIDFSDINDGKAYVENNDARLIWGRPDGHGGKAHVFGKVEFDDCEDPEELLQLTTAKLEELSKPLITYEAKVIDLNAYGLDHEGVELGDTVAVIDKEFTPELRLKARVVKIVRDLLEDENTITLGNFIPNIIDSTIEQETYINNFRGKQGVWDRARIIDNDGTINAQFLNNLIDELNTRMNSQGGYVYLSEDGKGIITTDKPTIEESTMAIQLLGGGFRIANSKLPNGEFDWRTFGDGNGFLADAFVGGLLKGGKVHFDLTNGTLLIGDSIENYQLYFDGNSLKIKLSSGKTIEETIEDIDVDIGDIGTRNYLRNSNEDNSFTEEIATSPTQGNFDIIYPDDASIPGEDLNNFTNLNAIQYELTLPLEKDQVYTLSIYGDLEEDSIGVWLGNDKFIGYIINGVMVFTPLENYSDMEIQIKSLSEEGIITHAKLEKGKVLSDWTPAPEDYDNKANQDNVNELRSDVVKAGAELEKLSNLMQDQREELNNKLDRNDLVVDVYYGENIVSTKSSNWNDGKLIEKIEVRPNSRMVVYSEIGNGQPEATRCMFTFYDENNNILRSTVLKSSTEEDISDYPYSYLTPIGNEVYLDIEFLNAMPSETDLRNGRFKVEYGREATEFTLALNDINGDHLEQGQVNSTTEPESPMAGLVWWNPSNLELNKYDGMDWNLVGWMTQQDLRDKIIANETSLEVLNDSVILEISKIREDQEAMTTHFNFTEEGLEIGKTDDPFDIRLSNKRLDFNKDNVPIAWISSEEENLYIKNAQITDKMIMGVHMIEKYSDGVTYIRYIGQAVDTPPGEVTHMGYYNETGDEWDTRYMHFVTLDDSETPLGRGNPDGFIFAHYKLEGMENPGEPWLTIAEGTVNSPPGQDIKAHIWYNMGMIGAYGRMRITWTLTFEKFTDITLTATKTYWSFF